MKWLASGWWQGFSSFIMLQLTAWHRRLGRAFLACFLLSLLLAVFAPLRAQPLLQPICSASGEIHYVDMAGSASSEEASHDHLQIQCALCLSAHLLASGGGERVALPSVAPQRLPAPVREVLIASRKGPALPPRGPPILA